MSSRRRLRVICSSDEEDDVQEIQPPHPPQHRHDIESETLNFQGVTLNSSNSNPTTTTTTNPRESVQIDISDEDFIDAAEDLSPSPPPPPPPSSTRNVGMSAVSDNPISRILEDLGLRLRGEWLDSCIRGLQTAIPGFSTFDATRKAKLCFEKFLLSDMNYCGAGLLPSNVHQMHLVDLPGPFVLQVDEIVNISQPLRERYKKAHPGLKRCLKLSMTDGVQRVFGMEYQPIKDLDALASAGLKVAISNVNVRHGLLMLVPEVFQLLGGLVEELDAARQRLVSEVNKPPRGKRTRTGVVPPLATRATRAAWPASDINVSQPLNNPVSQSATPMEVNNQGTIPSSANGNLSSNPAVPVYREDIAHQPPRTEVQSSFSTHSSNPAVPVYREDGAHQPSRTEVQSSVSTHWDNIEPLSSMATTEISVNTHMEDASFAVPIITESVETTPLRGRQETTTAPIHRASPVAVSDDEDVPMPPAMENCSAFDDDTISENPFTYLASLSTKWAASKDKASHVEGKIKCFVTGVKGFQYKQRSTYELQLYVDDGSLISEILVDHNVVQKKIGYSPEEVNAALSCEDPSGVRDMKDTMKKFQVFLVNFEGIMVLRINEALSLPVAIEMQQGCPLSDAWLLLRRLKSSNGDQCTQLDPINISP